MNYQDLDKIMSIKKKHKKESTKKIIPISLPQIIWCTFRYPIATLNCIPVKETQKMKIK